MSWIGIDVKEIEESSFIDESVNKEITSDSRVVIELCPVSREVPWELSHFLT